MKILNIMLSRDLGGIQQAFLDYSKALIISGQDFLPVISKGALIEKNISGDYKTLSNLSSWDLISKIQLYYICKKYKPNIIIAHGKRAITFALFVKKYFFSSVIIVGVGHNYWHQSLLKCNYILSITSHLKNYLIKKGYDSKKIFVQPNTIDCSISFPFKKNNINQIPVIGTIARFVPKKGIDIFLHALSILKQRGFEFKAIIGGEGEENNKLKKLQKQLYLENEVIFPGWIKDKEKFFNDIDIFCLPSVNEPFGIIILEAMLHNKPIVSTASEGPSEILTDGQNALLCKVNTAVDMAEKLIILIEKANLAQELASNAYLTVKKNYDISIGAELLTKHLKKIESNGI